MNQPVGGALLILQLAKWLTGYLSKRGKIRGPGVSLQESARCGGYIFDNQVTQRSAFW